MKRLTKSIRNVPLIELHNQYILRGYEIDIKKEEQIIVEIKENVI